MKIEVIYEDKDILAINKTAGLAVFFEKPSKEKSLADYLIESFPYLKDNEPPRYGIAHRLDRDTSGVLLVAKTPESLNFLQKQFKNRTIQKKYLALVVGTIKENFGLIETLIGRSPKDGMKQAVLLMGSKGREAMTEFKVLERYEGYTLLEVTPKTGRKHQIRCHLAHIQHPIAGDKVYGFKGQPTPKGLTRQFLHASYLKFGNIEIKADMPEELSKVIKELKIKE